MKHAHILEPLYKTVQNQMVLYKTVQNKMVLYKTVQNKTVLDIRCFKGVPCPKQCSKQKCIDYIEK